MATPQFSFANANDYSPSIVNSPAAIALDTRALPRATCRRTQLDPYLPFIRETLEQGIENIRQGKGLIVMTRIREISDHLLLEQNARLHDRQEQLAANARANVNLSYIAIFLSMLIAGM